MITIYLNEDIYNNKICNLISKEVRTIESVAVDIIGHTIYRDSTKLLLDGVRYDYINNELVEIE